jgi:hypothetical protein
MRLLVILLAILGGLYLLVTQVLIPEPPTTIRVIEPTPATIRDLSHQPADAVDGHLFHVTSTVEATWRVGRVTAIEVSQGSDSLVVVSVLDQSPGLGQVVRLTVLGQSSVAIGSWSGPTIFIVISWTPV